MWKLKNPAFRKASGCLNVKCCKIFVVNVCKHIDDKARCTKDGVNVQKIPEPQDPVLGEVIAAWGAMHEDLMITCRWNFKQIYVS